jgi:hypothetical protein
MKETEIGTINGLSMSEFVKQRYALKELFEDPDQCMIAYPFGTDDYLDLVIGEAFVYPEGVFFFDTSWNSPEQLSHFPGHFLPGKISKPLWVDGLGTHWTIGKRAVIRIGPEHLYEQYKNFYATVKDDPNNNRTRAKLQADKYVQEWRDEQFGRETT